jgi:hypothetical protein
MGPETGRRLLLGVLLIILAGTVYRAVRLTRAPAIPSFSSRAAADARAVNEDASTLGLDRLQQTRRDLPAVQRN